ncbi:DNA alkylation repair protein [Psychromonas sp. RZ22]|uniref:DNA alkylation repair protein n=1 Tax=Psychromonas algarum TaxID=2555643 RepID=UPI001067F2DC|nr:DNA alkylation repair protein [Psychromonas sp. RZ22]TEW56026.1 DNA alkylation repair protein [Psychromonas sp. RZ22]
MAVLLKDVYNQLYITNVATVIHEVYPDFKKTDFIHAVFNNQWKDKELKARTFHIAQQLHHFITLEYKQAVGIIQQVAKHFTHYEGMFIPTFVELYGLDEFKISVKALAYITQFSSAEFAIRPFIERYPEQMHQVLLDWATNDDEHIRRLASEGCRPRLPWAMSLPLFKQDPRYILPILEILKDDCSEYVRRSVANNLNDIAKDHPQIVINLAKQWLAKNPNTQSKRLVKHACRSLLKQADPDALVLFGFLPPKDIQMIDFVVDEQVSLGGVLYFSCLLKHQYLLPLNKLRIEFAIDFMKKNGLQSRKIFQLSESVIKQDSKNIKKSFSFKKISTRQYYLGLHSLAILVNGVQLCSTDFILTN